MSNLLDDADYVASRKSLLVVSCSVLLFYYFSDRIESISLLGTTINTSPGHVEIWRALWFLLLYQVVRYFQIFDYKKISDRSVYLDKKENYVYSLSIFKRRPAIKRKAIHDSQLPVPEKFESALKFDWSWVSLPEYKDDIIGDISEQDSAHVAGILRKSLRFTAKVTYVVSFGSGAHIFYKSGSFDEEVRPGKGVLLSASAMALLWMLVFQRWGTDYIFPPFLVLIVFKLTTDRAWDLSSLGIVV